MDVIIVGGGIGGLTLGLALHRAGIPCRIYEAAPAITPVGVGINVLPHATRELASLDLEPALARVAIATAEATFFNRFGQLIYQEPAGRAAGYDWPQFSIHRGDLQMVLLDAFLCRAGRRPAADQLSLRRLSQDAGRVSVHFENAQAGERAAAAWCGRDRLRRHQFGHPQAALSRRGRAALFRRQHVARRDALEADVVGRQHGACGLARTARW